MNNRLEKGGTIMSKKEGYSRPGLFGGINHYDANVNILVR